jgi:quercetin dioxygenase-like cupin family protein
MPDEAMARLADLFAREIQMRSRSAFAAAALLLCAAAAGAQAARDAVTADPEHHQVILENDYVRVVRGVAGTGAKSPMHVHPATVMVSHGSVRSRHSVAGGPGPQIMDLTPGQVLFTTGMEHSWEIVTGQVNVIGVELKRPAPTSVPKLPPTDAVTVDPVVHHVVLENEHVRVFQVLASPGARTAMHSHSRGMVLISAGRARVNLANRDGSRATLDFHPGQAIWLDPGVTHSWTLPAGTLQLTVVEVKAAHR